ncbi:MAG: hypothetical protein K2X81_17235 [Candidatus Obscuribacterales bacterium]|nr:hypothetical protein [Candidatus Obscuribacterales bacterium]
MKTVLTFICSAFALCCLSPEVAALPKQTKKTNTPADIWVLQQTHADVGTEDVYIAPDAIKIFNRRSGYELLCKAPKWEVHGFRRSEKLEWIAPLSLFDGLLIGNPNADPRVNKSVLLPKTKGKKLGLNYTHFTPRTNFLSSVDGTADIVTAPEAQEFICRLYRCPNTHTVPLQITNFRQNRKLPKFKMARIGLDIGNDLRNGQITELSTQSWKKIPYTADIFALPLSYKLTMSLPQVTFSNAMKNQFDEMFREGTVFRSDMH